MWRKVLAMLLALGGLWLGGGWLARTFASDESKIRAIVERMAAAYNTGAPGSCVEPLAASWRHEGFALDRQMLLGALFQASRERERETRRLLSRVQAEPEAAEIVVDGDHARLACDAHFSRLRKGNWEETWHIRIQAELEKGEDGWKIVRSRHTDLAGTHLGR